MKILSGPRLILKKRKINLKCYWWENNTTLQDLVDNVIGWPGTLTRFSRQGKIQENYREKESLRQTGRVIGIR